MLFSIIIPVYNVENYLNECLQSIIPQAEAIQEDCEILLINDGSTDASGKICELYQKRYPHLIKVFHNTNQGLLLTRRFGYKKSQGEYIVNCDSDDKLESTLLNTIKEIINAYNKPDVVLFNYNRYTENGHKKVAYNNIFSKANVCSVKKERVLQEFLMHQSIVSLCCKVYKRCCIDVEKDYTSFSTIGNGEDTLQTIELFNRAQTYVYINNSFYNYRIGSGMTRKYDPNYFYGFKQVLEIIKAQKNQWNLYDFDLLFSIKVLQTVGRAITQSRYNKWNTNSEHQSFLKDIRIDPLTNSSIKFLFKMKTDLQTSHFIFLLLFKYKCYHLICLLLNTKNRFTK